MILFIPLVIILFGTLIYFGTKKKKVTLVKIKYIPYNSKLTDFELQLLNEINTHRKSIDVNQLVTDTYSKVLAEKHCNYMININKPSHNNFAHRSNSMLQRGALSVGEVVGYGYNTSNGFLNGYLNSLSHKKVIENSRYTHVGISVLSDKKNRNYNCIVFTKFK